MMSGLFAPGDYERVSRDFQAFSEHHLKNNICIIIASLNNRWNTRVVQGEINKSNILPLLKTVAPVRNEGSLYTFIEF